MHFHVRPTHTPGFYKLAPATMYKPAMELPTSQSCSMHTAAGATTTAHVLEAYLQQQKFQAKRCTESFCELSDTWQRAQV